MVHQCSSVFHTEIKTVTELVEPQDQFWEPTLGTAQLLQPMSWKLSSARWKFSFFFSSLAGFGLVLAISLGYLGFRKGCFLKQEILALRKKYNLAAQASLDTITSILFLYHWILSYSPGSGYCSPFERCIVLFDTIRPAISHGIRLCNGY